jgi:hypothetical protein
MFTKYIDFLKLKYNDLSPEKKMTNIIAIIFFAVLIFILVFLVTSSFRYEYELNIISKFLISFLITFIILFLSLTVFLLLCIPYSVMYYHRKNRGIDPFTMTQEEKDLKKLEEHIAVNNNYFVIGTLSIFNTYLLRGLPIYFPAGLNSITFINLFTKDVLLQSFLMFAQIILVLFFIASKYKKLYRNKVYNIIGISIYIIDTLIIIVMLFNFSSNLLIIDILFHFYIIYSLLKYYMNLDK